MVNEMKQRVGAAILLAETQWTPKSSVSKEQAMAEAALSAMREPTDDMLGVQVLSHFDARGDDIEDNVYFEPSGLRRLWITLVDKALE